MSGRVDKRETAANVPRRVKGHPREVNRLLFALADAVNATIDLDELYRRIHELLGEVLDVTNIFIALVDLEKRTIRFPYHVDESDDDYFDITDFDTSRSLTGVVALAKRPILLGEEELKAREEQDGILGTRPKIWMGVPLIVRDEVKGVVAVQSYHDADAYDQEDLRLLAAVSQQIAIAIDRKLSLDALTRSEHRYRQLFEHLNDGLFLLDGQLRVVDGNGRAQEMVGVDSEPLIGRNFLDLLRETDRPSISRYLQALMVEPQPLIEAGFAQGEKVPLEIEVSGRSLSMGAGTLLQLMVRDITERKMAQREKARLEVQLNRSKKMEALGLLASGVAHDLNNILSAIVSYPELMLMTLERDHALVPKIRAIHEAGRRAADVVDDLLTIARSVATVKTVHSLHRLIGEYLRSPECLQHLEKYPQVTITTRLAAENPHVRCSAIHVRKSLMNLVNNAMEASFGQGLVCIETFNGQSGEEASGPVGDAGATVILRVSDDGPGIAAHDLEHIFDPFYTKKTMGKSGTGLGLAIVWNTMVDHEGEVRVESDGRQTRFSMIFPAVEALALPDLEPEDLACFRGQGETVLVVDDEEQLRDIASQILTSLGYRCWAVASGDEAVSFLRRQAVDVVLLDMLLGGGMNGRETYEQMIRIRPGQRAVIASGFSVSDEVNLAIQLGVSSYIKKPYTVAQLGQALGAALRFPRLLQEDQG